MIHILKAGFCQKALRQKKEKEVKEKMTRFLLQKLKEEQLRPQLCLDNQRLDFGLIITRPPVFLALSEKEMAYQRVRHGIMKKYNMYAPVTGSLGEVDKSDPLDNYNQANNDNAATHMVQQEDKTYRYYSQHSKHFKQVDPTVIDHHSIQHAPSSRVYFLVRDRVSGRWQFPSQPVIEKDQTAKESLIRLFQALSANHWSIAYVGFSPVAAQSRALSSEEQADKANRKASHVKTFYFQAAHQQGITRLYDHPRYDDYAWVTADQLGSFLPAEDLPHFRPLLEYY